MNGGAPKWRNVAVIALVPVILAAQSCTQETKLVGPPEVRFKQEQVQRVAQAKIMRDGEQVGSLLTLRVHGRSGDRVVHQVKDNYLNSLGFIDEQNCAYRLRAHSGAELVSNSPDRRRSVAAILGAYGSNIELVEEQVAPATEIRTTPIPSAPR